MSARVAQIRLIVGTAFRTSPAGALALLILVPLGEATQPLLAFWLALMLKGALHHQMGYVITAAIAIVVSQGFYYIIDISGTNMRFSLSEKVGHAFDQRIAWLNASLPRLDHLERPDVQQRLELLRETQGSLGNSLQELVMALAEVVVALVSLGLLIVASPILLLLVPFGLPALYTGPAGQAMLRRAEDEGAVPRRLARHWHSLAESPVSAAMIRVSGLDAILPQLLASALHRSNRPVTRARQLGVLLSLGEQLIFALGYLAAIGFTIWRARHGQADASDVVLVAVVGLRLQGQIIGPIKTIGQLGQTLRAAERMLWLEDYARGAQSASTRAVPAISTYGSGRLRLQDVTFTYPQADRPSLTAITTELRPGSVVAIVGENGAGKSTLVNLLCGFYLPSSGRILLNHDTNIAQLDPAAWRTQLSATFQDYVNFEVTAGTAIGIGDLSRLADTKAINQALSRAGATELVPALPRGLDTQLGARWPDGIDISGGQWQSLALARASMRDTPRLVVLDEPTASLDAQAEHDLFTRYTAASQDLRGRGAVTVLVSHRFSTVRMADHIIVLDHGRLVEEGTHTQLITRRGFYQELYTLQADGYRR